MKRQSVSFDFQNGSTAIGRPCRTHGPIEYKGVFPGQSNGQGPPIFDEKGRHGDDLGRPTESLKSTSLIAHHKNPGNSNFADWRIYCDDAHGNLDEVVSASKGTAASTIEALLYELRSGLSCLADEGARGRLRACDEAAMGTIAAELWSWKDKGRPWLPAWSREDVANLIDVWEALR